MPLTTTGTYSDALCSPMTEEEGNVLGRDGGGGGGGELGEECQKEKGKRCVTGYSGK